MHYYTMRVMCDIHQLMPYIHSPLRLGYIYILLQDLHGVDNGILDKLWKYIRPGDMSCTSSASSSGECGHNGNSIEAEEIDLQDSNKTFNADQDWTLLISHFLG